MSDRPRFLSYIDHSREYYAAQGYEQPYRWASHTDAPLHPLSRPVSQARVGLITTALRQESDALTPFAATTTPPPRQMATDHLHWHQTATHTDDLGSFLPVAHLDTLAEAGTVGSASPRYYGIPTIYSQQRTLRWAAQLVAWLREDDVDVAIFSPL
ncbi:MAG: hypothetical protein ACR2P0_20880 [Acidimicrobiales bacterium]